MTTATMELEYIPLAKLKSSQNNARTEQVKDSDWNEFKQNIKTQGILQPLMVRKLEDGDYAVIAGNRRLQALQEIYSNAEGKVKPGTPDVPCSVIDVKEAIDELILSSDENLHRLNLSPTEWAEVVRRLKLMGITKQADIAKRLGKTEAWVSMVKQGKEWKEHKKTTSPISQERGPSSEEFECPACGNIISRTQAQGEKAVYEVVGKENAKEKKGGKKK